MELCCCCKMFHCSRFNIIDVFWGFYILSTINVLFLGGEKVARWLWQTITKDCKRCDCPEFDPEHCSTFVFWGSRKRIALWHSSRGEGEAEVGCVLLECFTVKKCTILWRELQESLCNVTVVSVNDWSCFTSQTTRKCSVVLRKIKEMWL